MSPKIYKVLFLCTGNSARSILAEALLDHWGPGFILAQLVGLVLALPLLRRWNAHPV